MFRLLRNIEKSPGSFRGYFLFIYDTLWGLACQGRGLEWDFPKKLLYAQAFWGRNRKSLGNLALPSLRYWEAIPFIIFFSK